MKIIATMITKNEDWIIGLSISQLKKAVDDILVLDTGSEDDTVRILRSMGAKVRQITSTIPDNSLWRQELVEWGRAEGATHFVCLDADEVFTTSAVRSLPRVLASTAPGQRIQYDWVSLWKSPYKFRDDDSIWSRLVKDFAFHDDGNLRYDKTITMHEGRTPASALGDPVLAVPRKEGAVLHFQFVPWKRFQGKQAWYRCVEFVKNPGTVAQINQKYAITLDEGRVRLSEVPAEWYEGLEVPAGMTELGMGWFHSEISAYFQAFGAEFFEPVEIWHIEELRREFKDRIGRLPRPVASTSGAWRCYYPIVKRMVSCLVPGAVKRLFLKGRQT